MFCVHDVPRTSLQSGLSIRVDRIRARSFRRFVPDELERVRPLHVPDVVPRASPQSAVSIGVDKIRAGSVWGFVPDELEKVRPLHALDVRGVVSVSLPRVSTRPLF